MLRINESGVGGLLSERNWQRISHDDPSGGIHMLSFHNDKLQSFSLFANNEQLELLIDMAQSSLDAQREKDRREAEDDYEDAREEAMRNDYEDYYDNGYELVPVR